MPAAERNPLTGHTASRALVTDATGTIIVSAVTSAELAHLDGVTAPTGTGALVLATSPTLVTPAVGAATATSLMTPTLNGGDEANDDITIQGTTHATRATSYVNLQPNGGNVGIGTAEPVYILDVRSSISAYLNLEGTETNVDAGVRLDGLTGVNWQMYMDESDSQKLKFYSGSHLVTFQTNGNVGIGTMTPNQKLTVEGTMDLKEQAAAGADTGAYGQIWVKNDTPNELYFTDDAGTDTLISPHAKDAPPDFYKPGEVPGRVAIHKQVYNYSGVIAWERGDLYREESFADYNARRVSVPGHVDLVQKDWDVYQQKQVEATKARHDEWRGKLEEYRAAVAKWKRLPWPLRGELPSPPGDEPHVHEYESNPLAGAA